MKKLYTELNEKYKDSFLSFPWEKKEHLAVWSAQTYYYTKHITRIMALCSAHCDFDKEDVHKFFIEHLREEMGHHRIAEKDVEKLGYSVSDIPELPSTRLFYEPQYYRATKDPLSFYGFGLMLEWLAVGLGNEIYTKVKKAGLESNFLKIHIKEDVDHSDHAEKLISKFSASEMIKIEDNCHQTFVSYDLILKEAYEYAQRTSLKKVA